MSRQSYSRTLLVHRIDELAGCLDMAFDMDGKSWDAVGIFLFF